MAWARVISSRAEVDSGYVLEEKSLKPTDGLNDRRRQKATAKRRCLAQAAGQGRQRSRAGGGVKTDEPRPGWRCQCSGCVRKSPLQSEVRAEGAHWGAAEYRCYLKPEVGQAHPGISRCWNLTGEARGTEKGRGGGFGGKAIHLD